ncbi:hypothetical protein ACTNBL_02850 [Enterococcus villorum]|uniref:Uncharacterized protein n=1 Tax=Enterococcus villorum ATCC 700913 TaxID=1158604 RepID=A0ABP2US04_9ENTE|nr:hypothetical protein UAO_01125 [Enterococcus villorum ATCC 700913]EOW78113.1 hypothetical protein I591_00968 [Enterococcus villorum ATCC 700913]
MNTSSPLDHPFITKVQKLFSENPSENGIFARIGFFYWLYDSRRFIDC